MYRNPGVEQQSCKSSIGIEVALGRTNFRLAMVEIKLRIDVPGLGRLHNFRPSLGHLLNGVSTIIAPQNAFGRQASLAEGKSLLGIEPSFLEEWLIKNQPALFVWVPKTAGTSLISWLAQSAETALMYESDHFSRFRDDRNNNFRFVSFGHFNIDSLLNYGLVMPQTLETLYSFAFVRNPFQRAVSLYKYALLMRAIPKGFGLKPFFQLVKRQEPIPGLYHWAGLSMAAPMCRWIQQNEWSGPHKVFKIEDFDKAAGELMSDLGLNGGPGHMNSSRKPTSEVDLSDSERNLILSIYREDFELFEYDEDFMGH